MKINVISRALLIMITLINFNSFAEQRTKKITTDIESDRLDIDRIKLVNVFTGNAKLYRDKLVINADKIIVVQKKDPLSNKNKIDYIEAYGNPATLTDYNADNEKIDAFAKKIIYNQNNEQIKLKGDAKMITDDDNLRSQIIWYNKISKEMKAGKLKEETADQTSRVKIQFIE